MPLREQLARTPEPPWPKGKKQSRLSRVPDREGKESQGERDLHLDEKEGDQSESMREKGWTPLGRKANSKEVREGAQEGPP